MPGSHTVFNKIILEKKEWGQVCGMGYEDWKACYEIILIKANA